MPVKYGSLPFDAQIAFFRKKLALPTRGWTDIWQANHDHAFVVAGATKMALLEDMQAAVQKAIEQGTTLAEFRKDFDKTVAKHGWTGWKGEDTEFGRAWRSSLIYRENLRSSYNAGRYEQLQQLEYWQYHHSIASANPRKKHLAWDGMVLAKDDPAWQWMYPANGFGCACWVTGMSRTRMELKGLAPSSSPEPNMRKVMVGINTPNPRTVLVPEGVSPGFAYAPGRSAWMHSHIPTPQGEVAHGFDKLIPAISARDLLPEPRRFSKDKLLSKMKVGQEEDYVRAFLKPFGASIGKGIVFKDVAGEAVVISEALFKDAQGNWKIGKGLRSSHLLMLSEAIREPDEIWGYMHWHGKQGKAVGSRTYIARYNIDGKQYVSIVVMGYSKGWHGITAHSSMSADDFSRKIERNRKGVRLYKREQ